MPTITYSLVKLSWGKDKNATTVRSIEPSKGGLEDVLERGSRVAVDDP
jgi:hypothetical protein